MAERAGKRARMAQVYPGRSSASRSVAAAQRNLFRRTQRLIADRGDFSIGVARTNAALASRAGVYGARVARANRMRENKTFDPVAGVTAIANCFSTNLAKAGTPFTFAQGGSAWVLNQIPIGNSSITRVGRRYSITACALRGSVFAGTTGTTACASLVLVWDRKPNNITVMPDPTAIFAVQNSSSLTNKDNAPRFKILRRWDWVINGDQDAANQCDNTQIRFDDFVKMKNKVTILTTADTTGELADMVEGALYLYALGDKVTGTTAPSLNIACRLYFEDN